MDHANAAAALIRVALLRDTGAVVHCQISMNDLQLVCSDSSTVCHWLLLLIHINECMNVWQHFSSYQRHILGPTDIVVVFPV